MIDDEAPEEGGLEPAEEPDAPEADAAEEIEAAPEPETYTREQLAELLGPRFERFASHQGEEAFRQFGQAYDSATGLIRKGAHLEPQDASVYQSIGLDPAEVPQPPQEEAPGLWGTPWQRPSSYEEVVAYAQSEDADARRLAWEAVAADPSTPEHVNRWYFSNWAQLDPAGATLYNQQVLQAQFEERLAEQEARFEARFGKTHEDLVERNVTSLMTTAASQIPGFQEHAGAVKELFGQYAEHYPGFQERFFAANVQDQLKELRRLTVIAASEAEPQRKAARAQAVSETDAAKIASRSETGRSNGAPETEAQAMKRRSLEDARRVGGRVY